LSLYNNQYTRRVCRCVLCMWGGEGGLIKECMWHWCLSNVNVLLIRRFITVLPFWNTSIRFDWFIDWFIDWFEYICICYSFSVVYMCFFSHGDVNHNFQISTTLWYYYTRWINFRFLSLLWLMILRGSIFYPDVCFVYFNCYFIFIFENQRPMYLIVIL
jgi:hypothetical protein